MSLSRPCGVYRSMGRDQAVARAAAGGGPASLVAAGRDTPELPRAADRALDGVARAVGAGVPTAAWTVRLRRQRLPQRRLSA
jgi:hypothetical protein